MYTAILLAAFAANTFAFPQPTSLPGGQEGVWEPASGTTSTCSSNSDKVISFYVGPPRDPVIHEACKEMMPECAWPVDERKPDTVCAQTIDFTLNGTMKSTQSVNVEDASTGNKMAGWAALFTVTPPKDQNPQQPVNWRMSDCEGYFKQLTSERPTSGCENDMGAGVGSLNIGGDGTLKNTVFDLSIVKDK